MANAPKIFLLTCDCGTEIEIVSGQAGGATSCPSCGRQVAVPKLRDFAGLRVKPVGTPEGRRRGTPWGMAQAVAVAGLALAAVSWCGALVVGAVPKAAFTADLIRSEVNSESDVALYEALDGMANASVMRMPMREEFELQRRAHFASRMSRALMVLGGVGAAVAAAAGLILLVAPHRP